MAAPTVSFELTILSQWVKPSPTDPSNNVQMLKVSPSLPKSDEVTNWEDETFGDVAQYVGHTLICDIEKHDQKFPRLRGYRPAGSGTPHVPPSTAGPAPVAAPAAAPSAKEQREWRSKSETESAEICRQNALTNAVNFCIHAGVVRPELVLIVAEAFNRFNHDGELTDADGFVRLVFDAAPDQGELPV